MQKVRLSDPQQTSANSAHPYVETASIRWSRRITRKECFGTRQPPRDSQGGAGKDRLNRWRGGGLLFELEGTDP